MSAPPADPTGRSEAPEVLAPSGFLESLMDTDLYSMGAFFSDQHPELVEEVIGRSAEIEQRGLRDWSAAEELEVEEAFGMLLTGLAVRYYKAVTG